MEPKILNEDTVYVLRTLTSQIAELEGRRDRVLAQLVGFPVSEIQHLVIVGEGRNWIAYDKRTHREEGNTIVPITTVEIIQPGDPDYYAPGPLHKPEV